MTVGEAVEMFLEDYSDHRYRRMVQRLMDIVDPRSNVDALIEFDVVRRLVKAMRDSGISPASERREMVGYSVLVRRVFGEKKRSDVMSRIRLRRLKKERIKYIPERLLPRLNEVLSYDRYGAFFHLMLHTGIRRGEALALRPDDFDMDRLLVRIETGKTVSSRRVQPFPYHEGLYEAVINADDFVFPYRKEEVARAWGVIARVVGCEGVTCHGIRHTYAVCMAKAGMPMIELMQRLGHKSIATTMKYAIYSPNVRTDHSELGERILWGDDESGLDDYSSDNE